MEFLTSICIAAVAMALFRLLIPENKFSKQISLLIACVFLLTGITAASSAEFNLEDSAEIGENADFSPLFHLSTCILFVENKVFGG